MHWAKLHGVELPNGHVRRMEIRHEANPPLYKQLAARAFELQEQGLLIAEIASEFNCDINTVRKSVQYWCELHGLPWVDGRTRRKGLERKSRPRVDEENGHDSGEHDAA
jgi:hypothetical protein